MSRKNKDIRTIIERCDKVIANSYSWAKAYDMITSWFESNSYPFLAAKALAIPTDS